MQPIDPERTKREHDRQTGEISRRSALKTGVAVSSGLAVGRAAFGTAGAIRAAESATVLPVHHFVRAAGDSDGPNGPFEDPVSPKPDDDDRLVSRVEGAPVDDGTAPEEVDGDLGQLTWAQFKDVAGRIRLKCVRKGTHVSMHLSGLVPKGLYTVWVVAFDGDFHAGERALARAFQNLVGSAPLGDNDGGENVFRASQSGEGQVTAIDEPATFTGPGFVDPDTSERCLLEHHEVHFIGALHLDDETYGPNPRPYGVEQFGFVARNGEFM